MIELTLIFIPLIYQFIMLFLNSKSNLATKLEEELVSNNIYILSDNFKYSEKKYLFLGIFYYHTSELCNIQNIIDVSNKYHIKYFISKLKQNDNIKIILNTTSDDNISLNLVNFLTKKNKIKITSYIPETTSGSSILLGLSSDKLYMSNNSYISPLKNLLECNDSTNLLDEKYGKFYSDYSDLDYLLERLFQNRKDLIKKIKLNFLTSGYNNIYYSDRDLRRMGFNVDSKIDPNINKIFTTFSHLKNQSG